MKYFFIRLLMHFCFIQRRIPDRIFLEYQYKKFYKRPLNLRKPRLFTEKLQWIKLYYHNPVMIKLVDKYEAKTIASQIIGKDYVIPIYGVWDGFDEIDFGKLPQSFVLKCTHDSGSYILCKDKNHFDIDAAKSKLETALHRNYYPLSREWPYKFVKPRIIAEQFLEEKKSDNLYDYKFFCFNGEPKIMYISRDASVNATTDFFDMDFNHIELKIKDPNSELLPERPVEFEQMKELARKLSSSFPHARIDFYVVNHHIYFGEITFFHNGGFCNFKPQKWDEIWGDWLKLPIK